MEHQDPSDASPTRDDAGERRSPEPSCPSCGHDGWFWADQKVWARVVVKRNFHATGNPYDVFRDPDDEPQAEDEDLLVDLRCPACNATISAETRIGALGDGPRSSGDAARTPGT